MECPSCGSTSINHRADHLYRCRDCGDYFEDDAPVRPTKTHKTKLRRHDE